MAQMKGMNGFGVLPQPTKEMTTNRAMRDKEVYQAGKECAEVELSRDLVVEYSDQQDKDCFNMGYSAGEYLNWRKR
jgi:hypothetical protein